VNIEQEIDKWIVKGLLAALLSLRVFMLRFYRGHSRGTHSLSRILLMEFPTFNIAPRGVTEITAYTGSESGGSGFIAMRWNFRHFRFIKEWELVYVFSVRYFSVHCASTNFTSDFVLQVEKWCNLTFYRAPAYTMHSTNRVLTDEGHFEHKTRNR
jgi:hypothetical protein